MARRLSRNVALSHPETGAVHVLYEGSDVPEWAEGLVGEHALLADVDPADDPAMPAEPPHAGAGSGADAWREYAQGLGVDVPADAKRDDIIALVDASKS